jgi:hypothetical protein
MLALLYHWSLGHLYYTEERSLIRWLVIVLPLAIVFAPRD